MEDPSDTLEERLSEFLPSEHSDELLVVYYNGHGDLEKGDGLVLASHNHPTDWELQRDAAAFWKALDLLAKDPGKISQPEIPDELQVPKYDSDNFIGSIVVSEAGDSDSGEPGSGEAESGESDSGEPDFGEPTWLQNFVESTWLQDFVEDHKIYQPIATVNWSNIHRLIMAAKCDVAIILDCCDSGAAAISGNETEEALNERFREGVEQLPTTNEEQQYVREILAACSWSSISRGDINDALVKVLNHEEFQEGMLLETLHDRIQKELGKIRLAGSKAAQPTRIRLHTSNIGRKLRLPARLG